MSEIHTAAGVVVFHTSATGERTYLLIRHSAGHWELPKGHIKNGETWQQTAMRELLEETGIGDAKLMPGFARKIQYLYRHRKDRLIRKTVCFALAATRSQAVRLSDEHVDFCFLECRSALIRLTHATTRAVLRDAEAFVRQATSSADR